LPEFKNLLKSKIKSDDQGLIVFKNLFNFHDPVTCISWGVVGFGILATIARFVYEIFKKEKEENNNA